MLCGSMRGFALVIEVLNKSYIPIRMLELYHMQSVSTLHLQQCHCIDFAEVKRHTRTFLEPLKPAQKSSADCLSEKKIYKISLTVRPLYMLNIPSSRTIRTKVAGKLGESLSCACLMYSCWRTCTDSTITRNQLMSFWLQVGQLHMQIIHTFVRSAGLVIAEATALATPAV